MDTKGGKWWWGGGGMNWEIGIDKHTLMCVKWITNKNLLYKKINKIKFKKTKQNKKNPENNKKRNSTANAVSIVF